MSIQKFFDTIKNFMNEIRLMITDIKDDFIDWIKNNLIRFIIYVLIIIISIFILYKYLTSVNWTSNKRSTIPKLFSAAVYLIPIISYIIFPYKEANNIDDFNHKYKRKRKKDFILNILKLFAAFIVVIQMWFFYSPMSTEKSIGLIISALNNYNSDILSPVYSSLKKYKPDGIESLIEL